MKIEKIERSKHQQERILVYLEGGDLLRVSENELLRFGLYAGLELSEETVVELRACGARSQTRARAANMISARPLSKNELQKRLRDKGASEGDAEDAAQWLAQLGALDDGAYAATLVRHYSAMGYGSARLREELRRRGVPRELWEQALSAAPPAETVIERVIAQKTKGRAPDEKERRRLCDMLLRRGFSWGEVKRALAAPGETAQEFDEP